MDPFISTPTTHEAFSLMLMERILQLEKELDQLKHPIAYTFKFSASFTSTYLMTVPSTIKTYVNDIMSKRSIFLPTFAFWKYDILQSTDLEKPHTVYFNMYVHCKRPSNLYDWKQWTTSQLHIEPVSGSLYELKMILKQLVAWHITLPYLNENNKVELWRCGGTLFEVELNPMMTDEVFTESSNYAESESLQTEYFRWIKFREWKELFYD